MHPMGKRRQMRQMGKVRQMGADGGRCQAAQADSPSPMNMVAGAVAGLYAVQAGAPAAAA